MIKQQLPIRIKVCCFTLFGLLFVHGAMAQDGALTVAVAANVKPAFDELALKFKQETGIEVQGVSGSTGKIAAQVESGAPFDVFLSADTETPDALYRKKLATTSPRIYAYGVLVLWTMRAELEIGKGLGVLDDPEVRQIAIANPGLAPYGRAALQALERTGRRKAVEPKVVYGESIGQTMQFADAGAADIALGAKSLVVAPGMVGRGRWVEVPKDVYDPIAQAVVVLKHGAEAQPDAARRFAEFLFTPEARKVFRKYGYVTP